jgi:hypothetical protein
MSPISTFDQLLAPIVRPLCAQADTLLDLRDAATSQPHPGRCVSCYFSLLADLPDHDAPRLTPIRQWLEQNVEIVALDNHTSRQELEVFPLDLGHSENLEECCQSTIRTVLHDRAFTQTHRIAMRFRFRHEESVA